MKTDAQGIRPGPPNRPARKRAWLVVCLGLLSPLAADAGTALHFPYQPDNIHSAAAKLPPDLRRVLVLPLTGDASWEQTESADFLYDTLVDELTKSKKFEVIRVTPAQLKARTGKSSWQAEDALPESLLDSLGRSFACNGVLFCHLTACRSYAPLALGWRLKLVDTRGGDILWSADEQFDAGRPSVQAGLRSFDRRELRSERADDGWASQHSPRRFGRYSIATLLRLLPER